MADVNRERLQSSTRGVWTGGAVERRAKQFPGHVSLLMGPGDGKEGRPASCDPIENYLWGAHPMKELFADREIHNLMSHKKRGADVWNLL